MKSRSLIVTTVGLRLFLYSTYTKPSAITSKYFHVRAAAGQAQTAVVRRPPAALHGTVSRAPLPRGASRLSQTSRRRWVPAIFPSFLRPRVNPRRRGTVAIVLLCFTPVRTAHNNYVAGRCSADTACCATCSSYPRVGENHLRATPDRSAYIIVFE